ncbi:hypothetical protein AX17_006285 [Amanita inopinata Kibby_2008]|nr:hypothetical protein AX17_006285 [Amanita inopinata Kibby_2008]
MFTLALIAPVILIISIAQASVIPLKHVHLRHSRIHGKAVIERHQRLISRVEMNSNIPRTTTAPSRKYVVAHHIVGNTYPYTLDDWADDITLAYAAGIDGFALNIGRDEWEPARVADAYEAARQSGLGFKLFLSLDMSSLPGNSPDDAQALRSIVRTYVSHPNQLQYSSRAVVSTFSGESCTFGQDSPANGWQSQFVQHPDLDGQVYFIPAFFVDPSTFGDYKNVMDGDFNWNSAWPIKLTTSFVESFAKSVSQTTAPSAFVNANISQSLPGSLHVTALANNNPVTVSLDNIQSLLDSYIGSMVEDKAHLDGLAALQSNASRDALATRGETIQPAYMAAASPWFFTHYGPDSYDKNFIYVSDQHLYIKRWESLIAARDQVDIVQILTWNDYGESDYIGPVKGAQPNSEAWVNGLDHTAWLHMTRYYALAFKTGSYPPVETDQLYMWARTHAAQAQATDDPVGCPTNSELAQDAVWVVVMATEPSTVLLCTDPNRFKDQKTFDVPAGITRLSVPIAPGGVMHGVITRGNQTIVELHPQEFVFQGSPSRYNFNAFVALASK